MHTLLKRAGWPLGILALGCLVIYFTVRIQAAVDYLTGLKPVTFAADENGSDESKRCGPKSLWVAACRLGQPVELQTFDNIPVDSERGTALGDLRKAAEEVGLQAEARQLSWEELKGLSTTAVLFIRNSHFVTVDPRETPPDGDQSRIIRVYDPDRVAAWWSRSELEAVWQGVALVVRRPTPIPAKGPRAFWQTCWEDSGLLREVEETSFAFHIHNDGSEPLELQVVTTGCNCTAAHLDATKLPPGATTTLRTAVNLRAKRGVFREYAVVRSNDPARSLVQVYFGGGVVNSDVVSARKIYWGSVRPGQSAQQSFFIQDPGEGRLKVLDARWVSQPGDGAQPIRGRVTCFPVEIGSPYPGKVGRFTMRPGDYVVEIEIQVSENCPAGTAIGAVEVVTNLPEKLSKFTVSLEGEVLPDIEVVPAAILLNDSGERAVAQVRLTRPSGRLLVLEQVAVPRGLSLQTSPPSMLSANSVEFTVRCQSITNSPVAGEGNITCQLRNGQVISVPVVVIPRPAIKQPRFRNPA